MSEPEPAGWDPSLSEALWRDTRSSGGDRGGKEADRLADHIEALWGDPRPDPEPDVPTRLLEAVWGPEAAREPGPEKPAPARGPEQLVLFDLPAERADPASPGPA